MPFCALLCNVHPMKKLTWASDHNHEVHNFLFPLLNPLFHTQINIKTSKNSFGEVFSICFSHTDSQQRSHRSAEAIFGYKILTKWAVSQDTGMYGVKISNLGHTFFNMNVTSQKKISSTPRFVEMLTLKYRLLQNCFNSSALSG